MTLMSLTEFLAVVSEPIDGLKTLRKRGQIALAFGRCHAYEAPLYLPVDAVVHMVSATLAKPYGQTMAAQLVRVHGDAVAQVIAESEANPLASFSIIDFKRGKAEGHATAGSSGVTPEQIAQVVTASVDDPGWTAIRVNQVFIRPLIDFVRAQGLRHGVNLDAPMMPEPTSPEFAELFAPFRELRNEALVTVRAQKRRETTIRKAGEKVRHAAELMH